MLRASSYSASIAAAAMGAPQRGIIHSAYNAAANIIFPGGLILSLNATPFTQQPPCEQYISRMPNGLQLSAAAGTFPFTALRAGMPVLFGAQRLHIEAIGCSLDLSLCSRWNPHIEHPDVLDMEIVRRNRERLARYISQIDETDFVRLMRIGRLQDPLSLPPGHPPEFFYVHAMAKSLCGRGVGLTPSGDDILAGWMATGWLLYGPMPRFVDACRQIVEVARRQTHLLSQCWLSYAARGDVAQPICALLEALTQEDEMRLATSIEVVLAMGATSGHDLIQGILLMLHEV